MQPNDAQVVAIAQCKQIENEWQEQNAGQNAYALFLLDVLLVSENTQQLPNGKPYGHSMKHFMYSNDICFCRNRNSVICCHKILLYLCKHIHNSWYAHGNLSHLNLFVRCFCTKKNTNIFCLSIVCFCSRRRWRENSKNYSFLLTAENSWLFDNNNNIFGGFQAVRRGNFTTF